MVVMINLRVVLVEVGYTETEEKTFSMAMRGQTLFMEIWMRTLYMEVRMLT